jgi:hypothetical protein
MGGHEKFIEYYGEKNLKGRDLFRDLGIDGRIILICI